MNQRMNEKWMNQRINQRMNKWRDESWMTKRMFKWINEWRNQSMKNWMTKIMLGWMMERMTKRYFKWMNEWFPEYLFPNWREYLPAVVDECKTIFKKIRINYERLFSVILLVT